jgi:L-aspartate oxidase
MRGEGARLVNARGEEFMKPIHPLGSLAPRDIVARGIVNEMFRSGRPCVYLDITHKDASGPAIASRTFTRPASSTI